MIGTETYLPGNGRYQVGDRLVYIGRTPPGRYVEDVPVGTEATITADNGYDYRYTLTFDEPTPMHISSVHPDGKRIRTTLRSSAAFGWKLVED